MSDSEPLAAWRDFLRICLVAPPPWNNGVFFAIDLFIILRPLRANKIVWGPVLSFKRDIEPLALLIVAHTTYSSSSSSSRKK